MTQQQRDSIALTKIEKYLDDQLDNQLHCPECKERLEIKDIPNAAVQLLKIRYDRLRAALSSHTVEYRGESLADALARLAKLEAQRNQTDSKPVQTEQEQERPAVH